MNLPGLVGIGHTDLRQNAAGFATESGNCCLISASCSIGAAEMVKTGGLGYLVWL